ncbi:MAG: DUF1588 domain-containing protein [Deltaproteobacteria bacterium]|nr:DUF1588 domain-containing protein [Deltaproteobacteria bacterium]
MQTRITTLAGVLTLSVGLGAGCYDGVKGMGDQATDTATDDGNSDGGDDDDPIDAEPDTVPEPLAGRLTDTQYINTVQDLFGQPLTEQEVDWLPRDVPIEGSYSTSVETQFFNTQYVLGYAYIARSLSERLDPGALRTEFGGCDDASSACLEAFIDGLGLRVFRRPLTDDEQAQYLELAATIAGIDETTSDDVTRGVTQMMLQAPPFLYRMEAETDGEPGSVRRLSGWELATRLSYFLWLSAPDEELLAFAAGPDGDGDYDAAALPEQVERMLADARFSRTRHAFWGDYSLASVAAFGSVEPDLGEQLRESLLATFDRISGVGATALPLTALFDGNELVMTPQVAEIAGASSLGEGLQVYDVSQADERRGVLTHPAFLAAVGTTSFVGRGVFMTKRVLCQHTAPPPSDEDSAAEIEQTAQATEGMTPREASEFRFGLDPVCLSCHTQFEPIAYAFERYDMSGRYVSTDDEGRALFSDGVLPAFGDRPEIPFDSAPELLTELAARPELQDCLVENMMEYAAGARPSFAKEFLQVAQTAYQDDGQTFEALVRAIASNERLTLMRIVAQ